MTRKAVVIGGAGFIGSHVADELTRRNFEVTIFDRVQSPWLMQDQKMCCGDILDVNALRNVFEDVDYVYHFGGIADIGEAKADPYQTVQTNVMGATAALEAAANAGVSRFIYASTMYVYSSRGSFYRASKQASELIVEAYGQAYDLDYTFLRFGSVYGPRAQPWNGLRRYVEQVVMEQQLEYRGTGKEHREYIHVCDAARLCVDILDGPHRNRAITVTGNQAISSKMLIDMIFEIAGIELNVNFSEENVDGDHYETTPYRYTPERAIKISPNKFVDFGQGILDIVEEIQATKSKI